VGKKVSDSPNSFLFVCLFVCLFVWVSKTHPFSEFFFWNSVLLCSFLWAVELIDESHPPSLQFFQTAKGKAPKEAFGGRLSGGVINVTVLHLHEHQLSTMRCVALNQIDASYITCIRSFVVLCPHYSTLSSPLPFRLDKISRKGRVFNRLC